MREPMPMVEIDQAYQRLYGPIPEILPPLDRELPPEGIVPAREWALRYVAPGVAKGIVDAMGNGVYSRGAIDYAIFSNVAQNEAVADDDGYDISSDFRSAIYRALKRVPCVSVHYLDGETPEKNTIYYSIANPEHIDGRMVRYLQDIAGQAIEALAATGISTFTWKDFTAAANTISKADLLDSRSSGRLWEYFKIFVLTDRRVVSRLDPAVAPSAKSRAPRYLLTITTTVEEDPQS